MIGAAILLAYLIGLATGAAWGAIKWLAARGIGPDGPTADRRRALKNGWNGIGPLPPTPFSFKK